MIKGVDLLILPPPHAGEFPWETEDPNPGLLSPIHQCLFTTTLALDDQSPISQRDSLTFWECVQNCRLGDPNN